MNLLKNTKRRGAVSVLVAIALVALLGLVASSIDLGRVAMARQQLQNAADAAALAGASALQQGMNAAAGKQAAVETAAANAVLGTPVTLDPNVDVVIGSRNTTTGVITPWTVGADGAASMTDGDSAVRVTARRTAGSPDGPIPLSLASIMGITSVPVTVRVRASG
jgi:Flp pilus assembly protein TadG